MEKDSYLAFNSGLKHHKKYLALFAVLFFLLMVFLFRGPLIKAFPLDFFYDLNEHELEKVYQEYKENRCEIHNFTCQVSERCACLSDEDFDAFDKEEIIELEYCEAGEYCYDKTLGCRAEKNNQKGFLNCYHSNPYFELVDLCPENETIQKDYCYCFNKATLDAGKDYYDFEGDNMVNIKENFRAIIDNGVRDYNYVRILPHIEICLQGEKCDFGTHGGKGCY